MSTDDAGSGRPASGGVESPEVVRVPAPSWFRDGLTRVTIVAIGILVGLWLFAQISGFLITLLLAIFLAFALEPAVNWLAAHGLRRGAATLLMMLAFLAATVFFAFVIGALVVEQVRAISDDLPSYVDTVTDWIEKRFDLDLSEESDQLKSFGVDNVGGLAGSAFSIFQTFIGVLFQVFTILLFTYYLCARGPQLRRALCSMLPARQQNEVIRAWDLAVQKTAGYIYSRALLGLASAVAHGILLWILDVPNALTLALFVGLVSQFIPTVGTYLAGALPVLVALSVSPRTALVVLVFVIVYQQLENYILAPPLSARTMEINPAVAFGAVIVGTTLFGVAGAFLALPLTATGTAFVGAYIKRHQLVEHESLKLDLPDDAEGTPGDGDEPPSSI